VKELVQHLRWIIKEEKKYDVPPGPSININVPTRTHLPTLGTQTCNVAALDRRYLSDEKKSNKELKRLAVNENQRERAACIPSCSHSVGRN